MPAQPGPHAAVMVMHNALGMGEMVLEKTRFLAGLGYVAVATDMYGLGTDFVGQPQATEAFIALHNAPDGVRSRAVAWHRCLAARSEIDPNRIAAVGYCFGGECVLELARSGADVKAAVSFHGLLTTAQRADTGAIRGQVAIYTGERDPYASAEDVAAIRDELSAAGAAHQIMVFSDAAHAFTDPDAAALGLPGVEYHALADRVSWAGTLALLAEVL
jgi:dienelactone hydrolase